jgi:hypothetical protein
MKSMWTRVWLTAVTLLPFVAMALTLAAVRRWG